MLAPNVAPWFKAGSFWRTLGYLVAGAVPLMAVHYAIGYGAIGLPHWETWQVMTADAVVVAFLALTLAGSGFVAARHAARRTGHPLIPPADPDVASDRLAPAGF